jgi:hypothetical protein
MVFAFAGDSTMTRFFDMLMGALQMIQTGQRYKELKIAIRTRMKQRAQCLL